jgi:hypothetical protein
MDADAGLPPWWLQRSDVALRLRYVASAVSSLSLARAALMQRAFADHKSRSRCVAAKFLLGQSISRQEGTRGPQPPGARMVYSRSKKPRFPISRIPVTRIPVTRFEPFPSPPNPISKNPAAGPRESPGARIPEFRVALRSEPFQLPWQCRTDTGASWSSLRGADLRYASRMPTRLV